MVGHTHEDIDQMFSCISKEAHTRRAVTLADLHHLIQDSFTPTPATEHLVSLWDFRSLVDIGINLTGMKEPHVFSIKKKDGRVVLAYKDWPVPEEAYMYEFYLFLDWGYWSLLIHQIMSHCNR